MMLKPSLPEILRARKPACAAVAVSVGLCLSLGAAGASAATAPAPIEGTWNFQNGQVAVEQTGTNIFQGTVVSPTSFSGCEHPVGQVIWQMQGSGTSYTGTHVWFKGGCAPNPGGESTWNITDTSPSQFTMTFCTAGPGTGPPDPSATPTHQVGSTLCYALTRNVAPGQVATPTVISGPSISGTPKVGSTLACSPGSWTNSPTGYGYQWDREGTPIVGAMNPTYGVSKSDADLTLTCVVTAFNLGGGSSPAVSNGVRVIAPVVSKCPAATGRLNGKKLGLVKLGMTKTQARHAFALSSVKAGKFEDVFCLTPSGVRVRYASSQLVRNLSANNQQATNGRVVLAVSANPFYGIRGVRPGATVAAAKHKLRLSAPVHAGLNTWYTTSNGASISVLEVRRGIVVGVGIADKRLTNGHAATSRLFNGFS